MGRKLSLLAHLPRVEADGITHRRDCECVRCDAGYRPTESERTAPSRRWDERRVREAAARALARRQERARVRAAAIGLCSARRLRRRTSGCGRCGRRARARTTIARLALLQSLRRTGMPLAAALLEVERRSREPASVGPAGFEPAANGLKVRSSTS